MRAAAVVLAVVPAGAVAQEPLGAPAAEAPPAWTVIHVAVADALDRVQRESAVERGMCLYGRVAPDTTYIVKAVRPYDEVSEKLSVKFSCRTGSGFIGTAHNHPPGGIGCAVSVQDLLMFWKRLQVIAVHTCTDEGRTAIVVRRSDRWTPSIIPIPQREN